ncbi:putative 2-hydroxyacid dehydrogenase UNK4.10 [Ceratocystis fimbriata CBS 114723]|uniref:Putative 2-hydroxyacid dehydrogenase UNK4.10 n=1 Tax=Ceratocystis fimbriata CBS 114723 TaxID=1035309 RepID=A0A2C5X461_9PEZI|nr:putative 2-hydroxyacid dehydrogenase UNK4.10 [Ceratocystis fimbriata CBS 114723]
MPERPQVLQLGSIELALATWTRIGETADILTPRATDRASFLAELATPELSRVSIIYRTFGSAAITGLFDAELVAALPPSVRFICHNGAGYDQIDVAACSARGVRVSNTPTAVDDATADLNIWLMLGALRGLPQGMAQLRRGEWRQNLPLGHDPQGKILGILGMGGIGRNMARKARAFGMTIRYYNRRRLSPELEEGAEYVDFETLLQESDVLSLNLPLNKNTRHTISTAQFNLMKKGVVIVNTARGAVMDEEALVVALDSGKVASVGLDVFEKEPTIHPGLLANDNVLLIPHMGTWTVESQTKMEEWAFSNVEMALKEGKLVSIVPEQADMA